MSLRIQLIIIFLCLLNKVFSYDLNGKIIFENDSINAVFIIPGESFISEPKYCFIQDYVEYIDSNGTKNILKAGQAKEFYFYFDTLKIRMISVYFSESLGNKIQSNTFKFLRLLEDGYVKLYEYSKEFKMPDLSGNYSSGGPNSTNYYVGGQPQKTILRNYIIQKGFSDLVLYKESKFKKLVLKYFGDCSSLIEKVEKEEFYCDEIEIVVKYYNLNCRR